jgi:hypothetical protein
MFIRNYSWCKWRRFRTRRGDNRDNRDGNGGDGDGVGDSGAGAEEENNTQTLKCTTPLFYKLVFVLRSILKSLFQFPSCQCMLCCAIHECAGIENFRGVGVTRFLLLPMIGHVLIAHFPYYDLVTHTKS